MADEPDIKYLFEPRGIAVIGASHNEEKIGYKILKNILSGGYTGSVYPVNPGGGEILGKKVYKGLDEIDGVVDVACIVIPAKFVFNVIKDCTKKGVKFGLIVSSGFSDTGNIEEEKKIVAYARERGMRILGPNIFGVYSAVSSLNSTFGPGDIKKGGVAIITQSGALGLAMIGKTSVENIGLSAIVSVGNKSDVDESDLLGYLVEQESTKVVLMYVEGIHNGEKLVNVLKEATRRKPIVVIKSGRSERGAIAAASHTGSLAGSDEVFSCIMKQCGVLRAESVKDAFNWCKFLANAPFPKGENTLIITNGGGIGVMAADACEKYGVKLFDDSKTLKEAFSSVTPDFGSLKNPVDLTGQATSMHYNTALDAALRRNEIDAVIALYCETAVFDAENLASMIERNYNKYREAGKPIVFSIFGGRNTEECITALRGNAVSVFSDVYEAVSCMGAAYSYYLRHIELPSELEEAKVDSAAIESITEKALAEGRRFLLAYEAREVMKIAGVTVPESRVARGLDEAIRMAEDIGYPVAMKIVSRDILHKSDVGGIALNLESREELTDAYEAIVHNCKVHKPEARIEGVEIAEMARPGVEVIIGARKDKGFGPISVFGLGGIYVEVIKDVSFRALPMSRKEVISMMKDTRSYPLLMGVRGDERKDIDSVVEVIMRIGSIIRKCKTISDIEVNPLVVYNHGLGVKAVDVRIMLSNQDRGGTNE